MNERGCAVINHACRRQHVSTKKYAGVITRHHVARAMEWTLRVCEEHDNFMEECPFLVRSLLDRYLVIQAVAPENLQLVTSVALLVASKLCNVYAIGVNELLHHADGRFTRRKLLATEEHMLNALEWDLASPTVHTFLGLYTQMTQEPRDVVVFSEHFMRIALVHAQLAVPSAMALACVALARKQLGHFPSVPLRLQRYYTQDVLKALDVLGRAIRQKCS